jgi:hypothetical protein
MIILEISRHSEDVEDTVTVVKLSARWQLALLLPQVEKVPSSFTTGDMVC